MEYNKVMLHSDTGQHLISIIKAFIMISDDSSIDKRDVVNIAKEVIEFSDSTKVKRISY